MAFGRLSLWDGCTLYSKETRAQGMETRDLVANSTGGMEILHEQWHALAGIRKLRGAQSQVVITLRQGRRKEPIVLPERLRRAASYSPKQETIFRIATRDLRPGYREECYAFPGMSCTPQGSSYIDPNWK